MPAVPAPRIRSLNALPPNPDGTCVLYWMTTARRLRWNFGLQRAVEHCRAFRKPLVVLEALRCDYAWASDRLHQFAIEGMAGNAREAAKRRCAYYPYVEPSAGAAHGLIAALSRHACVVVTDWYPAFFIPHMLAAASRAVTVALEAVDSNGLIPLSAAGRAFPLARSFRAFVQRTVREHLQTFPDEDPLAALHGLPRLERPPADVLRRWPPADERMLRGGSSALAQLPIDHSVRPVETRGGTSSGSKQLHTFLEHHLARYADDHNHPDAEATSRLSPYLHFGHLSTHEVFAALMKHERWTTRRLARSGRGVREGWWGASASAEAFLDQLVVWRELAFNTCEYVPGYASYRSLPEWARRTIEEHAADPRPHRYSLRQLEEARTHDSVWNGAQRQMIAEGWFHGYLRMLWGKKIFEWSPSPEAALERMEALMNRYSLDGRDPNSYAGYAWVLGRYDRPWPERPIFGTIRYMTSESARRKLRMRAWLARYGDPRVSASKAPARAKRQ